MGKIDLVEILAVYFDIIGHPQGAQLITGELSLNKYIENTITKAKNTIRVCERKLEEEPHRIMKAHIQKRMREAAEDLEKAEKWQKRGYFS